MHPRYGTPAPLQAEKPCNFEEFTDIIARLLNAAWGEGWGIFTEVFPNGTDSTNIDVPVITYTLKEMQPGIISKNETREIKPRHRHTFYPEVPGEPVTEVYGQVLDYEVLFEVWEENNTKASKLAERFRELLFMYTGFMKSQGVKELFFRRYSNETEGGEHRDNIVGRCLYYDLRLEHLISVDTEVIQRVIAHVTAPIDPDRGPTDTVTVDIE